MRKDRLCGVKICIDERLIDDQLTTVLCSCAMAWVKQNPEVIEPLEAEYSR